MILRSVHPLAVILALCWICNEITAHRIEIDPGEKACFYEQLQHKDRMSVTYEVGGATAGGHLDIDFYASDPTGKTFYSQYKQPTGSLSMEAASSGKYEYCFDNTMSTFSTKTLSFSVHGTLFSEDEEQIAPVEREIRNLGNSLQLVKDEQAYLVQREKIHRNTAESTVS
ncbi:supernatant protein factor, C-terminal domain-containing protein [Kockovaella imperatae]|uniref:Supernatant protein factor, C-terminal domain-containing protein n=1 Tax=Kockovaella imperatae TaxID=4999 RepID=A0A1Y1UFV0_9TREE|nr:supernatant protein factor, C-terminal domain-containing protein [Kockovaella imperatae]ORX36898.1 supernatant protein factor, C-terminal domain-containing protein [Kockovaella imperatae]